MNTGPQRKREVGRLEAVRPVVNFANRMSTFPGQTWGPRTIPDWQLVYVLEGRAQLQIGGESYLLHPHDCAYYGPGDVHRLTADDIQPFLFSSIHFRWDEVSPEPVHPVSGIMEVRETLLQEVCSVDILEMEGEEKVVMPTVAAYSGLDEIFFQIVREYRAEAPGYAVCLRALMLQLLALMVRQIAHRSPPEDARMKAAPALQAMRENPDRLWPSRELAELCGYHPTYFAQIFRQATGMSPRHYQMLERIERAKRLLLQRRSVENIAADLGYASIQYFSLCERASRMIRPHSSTGMCAVSTVMSGFSGSSYGEPKPVNWAIEPAIAFL
jgi:AraC family transcriptional activator of mtrCDE